MHMKHLFTVIFILFYTVIYAQSMDLVVENNTLKIVEYFENGNQKSISFYVGKKLETITSENLAEQIEKGKIKLEGIQKKFHQNGNLKSECTYQKGRVVSNSCKNYLTNGEILYTITDTPPTYEEGNEKLFELISSKTNNSKSNFKGIIYVSFIVDKTGKILDVKAFRGGDPDSKKIAENIVQELNGFSPAIQNGKAVNCAFNLPIRFE